MVSTSARSTRARSARARCSRSKRSDVRDRPASTSKQALKLAYCLLAMLFLLVVLALPHISLTLDVVVLCLHCINLLAQSSVLLFKSVIAIFGLDPKLAVVWHGIWPGSYSRRARVRKTGWRSWRRPCF